MLSIFSKLGEFFQEQNGAMSSARLVLIVWALGIFGIWGYNSVKQMQLQEIPESVIVMFGVATTGKVIQKFQEEKKDKKENP